MVIVDCESKKFIQCTPYAKVVNNRGSLQQPWYSWTLFFEMLVVDLSRQGGLHEFGRPLLENLAPAAMSWIVASCHRMPGLKYVPLAERDVDHRENLLITLHRLAGTILTTPNQTPSQHDHPDHQQPRYLSGTNWECRC